MSEAMGARAGERVRIADVAREAGVSIATVSRTLNGVGAVSKITRQRVLEAVEELGYSPNVHAASLASGRSDVVGLVVPDITNPFFNELARAVGRAANQQGMHLLLTNSCFDADLAASCLRDFVRSQVAGIVLFTSVVDFTVIKDVAREKIPVCVLDVDLKSDFVSQISLDFRVSTIQLLEHLVSLEHSRISCVSVRGPLKLTPARIQAFREGCSRYENYVLGSDVIFADYSVEGGEQAVKELFSRDPQLWPTAIWCHGDVMAFGAIRELKRRGLRIPQDVSVVGWGDTLLSTWSEPSLTTVSFNHQELGRLSIEAVRHLQSARIKAGLNYGLTTRLVVRDSTGPAPKSH
jgi:LacI family transcriptional regulator